jgi:FkbM family methyltransferase
MLRDYLKKTKWAHSIKALIEQIVWMHNLKYFIGDVFPIKVRGDKDFRIIGGKLINLSLLKKDQVIVSGGIGRDLDFERVMIKKHNRKIIAFDPTEISAKYVTDFFRFSPKARNLLVYVKKAITVDGRAVDFFAGETDSMASISKEHSIGSRKTFLYQSVSLGEIIQKYNVGYLKLDIEGSEYEILEDCNLNLNVPQIAIEFHHFCIDNVSLTRTINIIENIREMGYTVYDFGTWASRRKILPKYVSHYVDNNVELFFVKTGKFSEEKLV